jgi:arylsulfatase A-like enzyme
LENTYIFFVSDNGFHLGEHSLPSGKGTPYEEDIRVPLMVRGPGIEPGTIVNQMSANIDLAPTIADIADVDAPDFVDGRSFLPCLTSEDVPWRDGLLIEFGYIDEEALADPETDNLLVDVAGGAFRGIRGENFVYVEYANGELEFYDLTNDPYQLENLAGTLSADKLEILHTKLETLKYCQGSDCQMLEDDLKIEFQK